MAELSLKASRVLILQGVAGAVYTHAGQILFDHAPVRGIDANLLRVLEAAVDDLGIVIRVSSVDSQPHVEGSRHHDGTAVDIDRIGRVSDPLKIADLANYEARQLVAWLIEKGFTAGREDIDSPAVLFGPIGTKWNQTRSSHLHHLHVSLHSAAGE